MPLRRVIYVSNHGNPEVVGAMRILRDRYGLRTTHYGMGGDQQVRMTASEISDANVVITMGKTAQFALLARIPVYVYDYTWGGPGYISQEGFEIAADHNFSGSYAPRRLSADEIADEIVTGFERASQFALDIPQATLDRFSLDRVVEKILSLASMLGITASVWSVFTRSVLM